MRKAYKKAYTILAGAVAAIVALCLYAGIAYANPTYIAQTAQTSVATSTGAFMTPGTGTSTVTYDTNLKTSDGGILSTAPTVAVGIQTTASSTSTIYGISFQYSQDGIDWYSDFVNGTTTLVTPANLALVHAYTYKATGTSNSLVMTLIKAPTRYVRAVVSVTGANGMAWLQFIPTKEIR